MFMVNYFSKFVLIGMMIEEGIIEMGSGNGKQRIIFITSETHRDPAGFDWEAFGIYKEYGINQVMSLYGYNKLLLVTFARELSRRLNSKGQTRCSVFAMCPGPVNSRIARNAPNLVQPVLRIVFTLFFKSPAKAAIPVLYLAASPDLEGKPFDYFHLMNRKDIDPKAENPNNGSILWTLSEQLYEKISTNKKRDDHQKIFDHPSPI